jgi:hypothetical protein
MKAKNHYKHLQGNKTIGDYDEKEKQKKQEDIKDEP